MHRVVLLISSWVFRHNISIPFILISFTQDYCLCDYSINYPDPIARDYTKQFGGGNESGRFVPSEKVLKLRNRLVKFMEDHIYPMENEFYKLAQSSSRWTVHPEEESLKELAKKEGLWNLWIPVLVLLPF